MDVKPLRGESWFTGIYMTGHGPEDEVDIDESWLDDLNEAA
jgi:hypothetical protein